MKMLNNKWAWALTALALVSGCASTKVETTNVAAGSTGATEEVRFPDVGRAWIKQGTFVDVEQLRRMGTGLNKNQVRELLGAPHFEEGFFSVREWDYLFNFRTGKGQEYVTCQYKVVYKDGLSNAMYWKDPACAQWLAAPPATVVERVVPAAAVVAPPAAVPERVNLSADALFAFDKSGPADMLPQGRQQLDKLAIDLTQRYKRLGSVTVVGHTDRLGSDSYNQALSLARAATVRDYLVSKGVPAQAVRAFGVGKAQPVKQCADSLARAELLACLQPNRRVEIGVLGER